MNQQLTFGVGVSTSAEPGADPVAEALAAEDLGFDFVSASDHPSGQHPTFETWTMLTWIAASTSRICNGNRNGAVCATRNENSAAFAKRGSRGAASAAVISVRRVARMNVFSLLDRKSVV